MMNYPESQEILKKIKSAKNIIINCHYSPDPDSVGSALSVYQVLLNMGKNVSVFSSSEIVNNLSFLPFIDKIKVTDFSKVDFAKYDLFIALDSSTWDQAIGNKDFLQPNTIDLVTIDHHKSNLGYGSINLIDGISVAVCEILSDVFDDWNIDVDKSIATTLLTGIIGDSGAFRFPATTGKTLEIAGRLMKKGANKEKIIFNLFQRTDIEVLKFWGVALERLQIKNNFAWVAINNKNYLKMGRPMKQKSSFASVFLKSVDNSDFGFIAVEEKPGLLDVSLRSRTGFDTSKIALEMGGGGHIWASGLRVEGLLFDKAVEKVLETVRKYAKEN